MKRRGLSVVIIIVFVLLVYMGTIITAKADEDYTVTKTTAVLYSVGNGSSSVYMQPSINSTKVSDMGANLPVNVTGVTSNGWFQIDLQGVYYIQGNGLKAQSNTTITNTAAVNVTNIEELTKGTFAYYSNKQLRSFTKEDIEDMDENTYIRYLDSFLIGKAMVDYCIMKEDGLLLRAHYDGLAACDDTVKAMTLKEYLLSYRTKYLNSSLEGPIRSEKDLKLALTRAIRYNVKSFKTIYKNVAIGSDQEQMELILKNVIDSVKFDQGIIYSYTLAYGQYETTTGKESSGWIINFSYN